MFITKKSKRIVVDEHYVGIRCDVCGKEIEQKPHTYGKNLVRYAKCTRGHREWGIDSSDSLEKFDVCPQCLGAWIDESKGYLERHGESGFVEVYIRTDVFDDSKPE